MAHDTAADAHGAHEADATAMGVTKHHPTSKTYVKVGVILTLITAVEVWIYYIPRFVASPAFVPALLIMSAIKFATVVMFYMHLRYDHKLFRALFIAPLVIAIVTIIGLLFLFGVFSHRSGALV